MNKYILIFFVLIFSPLSGISQHTNLFFDLIGGGGYFFPNSKFKYMGGPVSSYNAKIGLKTLGYKDWQREFKNPELGIGLSHIYLTPNSFGNPTSIYSFLNLPLFVRSKYSFNLGLNAGLGSGFNQNSGVNKKDVLIGSKFAAYISTNINSMIRINRLFELYLSGAAYHISNGNTSKPNKGINIVGAEGGLRYTLTDHPQASLTEPVISKPKESSVRIFGSWGWTQESRTLTPKRPVGSLSTGFYRTINSKSRLSACADLFYDEGDLYSIQKDNQLTNVLAVGICGGHELTVGNFAILTQAGIYLRNPCPSDPFYYTRFGVRYTIAERIIPSISMKAHGLAVDFLEWGIGFVLWRR